MQQLKDYLPPADVHVFLYHGSCKDGFASAKAAQMFARENGLSFDYVPVYPNKPPHWSVVRGRNVVLADVTFPMEQMRLLDRICQRLVVLDHHAFVREELKPLDTLHLYLNPKQAACHITWRYFHGRKRPFPLFMRYIEVRDLYLQDCEEGHFFALAFYDKVPYDFDAYERFMDERRVRKYVERGRVMYKQIEARVKLSDIPHAQRRKMRCLQDKYTLYVLNCTHYVDIVGNLLAHHYRHLAQFVLLWYYNHAAGKTHVMLRSAEEGGADVAQIARYFGGGGHTHAASFMLGRGVSVEDILERSG